MSVPRKLVAVVDDDPRILKGVERLLLAHGLDAEVFASAEAFLGRNTGSNPICLLVDIHLAGIVRYGTAAPARGFRIRRADERGMTGHRAKVGAQVWYYGANATKKLTRPIGRISSPHAATGESSDNVFRRCRTANCTGLH
jgi:CheY-like chemotaxis protein